MQECHPAAGISDQAHVHSDGWAVFIIYSSALVKPHSKTEHPGENESSHFRQNDSVFYLFPAPEIGVFGHI
jgi:hypothetical protein